MNGPSPHLSWDELACHDAAETPYPVEWREDRAVQLADAFEAIREQCGHRPITVLSAYRTPEHNTAVGGRPQSQHLEGRALDLRPPTGMTMGTFIGIVSLVAERGLITGIGHYPTFVHIDVRPGNLQLWEGARPRADLEE